MKYGNRTSGFISHSFKFFLLTVGAVALLVLQGCVADDVLKNLTDNMTEKIDDAIGDAIGDAISGTDNKFGEKNGESVIILTPTPTPDPLFVPTPTPFFIPTPIADKNEPKGEACDEWVYVKSAVNVRSGWSTEYRIVGGIYENDCVHRIMKLENGWSKIAYNGMYAYCNSGYLTEVKPDKVATTHLDIMLYTSEAAKNGEDVYVLNVQSILQKPELLNGPEITSLAVVLKYLGYTNATKTTLAENYLKTAEPGTETPFDAYIGDPTKYENSYGCYAPVIVNAANAYFKAKILNKKCSDISDSPMETYYSYIDKGIPVIIWTTVNLAKTKESTRWIINDKEFIWRNNEHCVVLCGYNKTKKTVIVADPLKGLTEYDAELFEKRHREQYGSACVITDKY